MSKYSICPIAICQGNRDTSSYTYRMNTGVPCKSVSYLWYIEGNRSRTVIDTGIRAGGTFGEKFTTIEDGLAKFGLRPEDIEIVIVTHLHWDHIALGHLYTRARFIVQKREVDYAFHPHEIDEHLYNRSLFEDLPMEIVEGEKEIMPGVSVFLSPGHSPGGQSVEVDTSAGKVVVPGFCCHLSTFEQTEAMKGRKWQVTAPLIHQDVREAYDSVLRVKRRAQIHTALHDPAFIGRDRIP